MIFGPFWRFILENFFHGLGYAFTLTQKMGWATFWAIFFTGSSDQPGSKLNRG
jgi:hypothetical protein